MNRVSSMRRILVFAWILVFFSGCSPSSKGTEIFPTPTGLPSSILTPEADDKTAPSITPLPVSSLTPLPSPQILTDFPLALGAAWKYSAEISYQSPNDPTLPAVWSGIITDTVIGEKTNADGTLVFTIQEDMQPVPPQDVWTQPRIYEYLVTGDAIFEGGRKIFQWPLADGLTWKPFIDGAYEVTANLIGNVETPFAELNGCFGILLATLPDTLMDTFCPGVGFVEHSYQHNGTLQTEHFILVSFTSG